MKARTGALFAVSLLSALSAAFGAITTATITKTVYLPSGGNVTAGTVTTALSQSGTTSDGTLTQIVQGRTTATIGTNGAVTLTLVPNDAISPLGTYYTLRFNVTAPTASSWQETWSIATGGAITRLNVAPGVSVWPITTTGRVVYSNNGTPATDAGIVYDPATDALSVGGNVTAGGTVTAPTLSTGTGTAKVSAEAIGLFLGTGRARLSGDASGNIAGNYSNGGTGAFSWYGGGTTPLFWLDSAGKVGAGLSDSDAWDFNVKKSTDGGRVGLKAKNISTVGLARAGVTASMEVATPTGIGIETYGPNYTAPYAGQGMLAASGVSSKLFFGTVGAARAVLDTAGNWGLGPSFVAATPATPSAKLDVDGDAKITYGGNATYFSGAQINFSRSGANYIWADGANGSLMFGTGGRPHDSGNYNLYLDYGASKMSMFGGSVGIGAVPTDALTVAGSISATTNIAAGNNLGVGGIITAVADSAHDFMLADGIYNSSFFNLGQASRDQLQYARWYDSPNTTAVSSGTVTLQAPEYTFGDTSYSSYAEPTDANSTVVLTLSNTTTRLPTEGISCYGGCVTFTILGRSRTQAMPGTISVRAKYDDVIGAVSYNNPAGNGTTWRPLITNAPVNETFMRIWPNQPVCGWPDTDTGTAGCQGATGPKMYALEWTLTNWTNIHCYISGVDQIATYPSKSTCEAATPVAGTWTAPYRAKFGMVQSGEEMWPNYVNRLQSDRFPMLVPLKIATPNTEAGAAQPQAPFVLGANNQNQRVIGLKADSVYMTSSDNQTGPAAWAVEGKTCATACSDIHATGCATTNGAWCLTTTGSCTAATQVACSVSNGLRICRCY